MGYTIPITTSENNMSTELKNVDASQFDTSITEARFGVPAVPHPPRILMLYGSVRERSYSRLATEEAARLLTAMGAEVRIFQSFRFAPS